MSTGHLPWLHLSYWILVSTTRRPKKVRINGRIYIAALFPHLFRVTDVPRLAAFFSSAAFLSSFANTLAYGTTHISDQPERYGWRWIFIVQGALTVAVAIYGWLIMPDFPESKRNKFISADEMAGLKRQLMAERGDSEAGKVTRKVIKSTLQDWHTYPT